MLGLTTARYLASRAGEEGLACLAVASTLLGRTRALQELRAVGTGSQRGMTIAQLAETAAAVQLGAHAVRCEWTELAQLNTPAVLSWDNGTFVVLAKTYRNGGARLFDSTIGWRRVRPAELREKLDGMALEISLAGPQTDGAEHRRVSPWSFVQWSRGLRNSLLQVLVIALLAQVYALISPLYLRMVVDDVVGAGKHDLLWTATIAFGLLALLNAGAGILRGVVLQKLNNQLSWGMAGRVFHHLIRLPLEWFESHRLADTLSRLAGVDQVRNVLTGLLGAIFDASLTLIAVVMLFLISPAMLLVAIVGLTLLVAVRLIVVPVGMELNSQAVLAAVAEQSKRIETVRAIQSIKIMGGETEREADWQGRFAEQLKAAQRSAVFGSTFSSLQGAITALMFIAAVFVGGRAIIGGTMTVGTLTAALAYLTQFNQGATNLFQQIVTWRMLDVQLARVAEIVLEPVEEGIDKTHDGPPALRGDIAVEDLSFRFSANEPFLFRGLQLDVAAGEHVAIVGPSGAGKSTLLKLITGLYRAEEGQVLIDGQPLADWGPRTVRRMVGMVMQDDQLLSGSIADNVAFFDAHTDVERVWECLAAVEFDEEVRGFPLTTETPVGDMGAALSGGQRQRLLLARALYRRPRLLVLDEATSQLDVPGERRLVRMLDGLAVTRIVVAHRPDTISAADRVLRLADGILIEEPQSRRKASAG